MTAPPVVSVILSVRNGAADLPKAIDTILTQTFTDFELIAIDNGSIDGTAAVLDALSDPRVRVIHQQDMGLAAALNRGISLARGRYIARQDHDDWVKPTRLEKQVAFMEAHPDFAVVGTRAEIWVGDEPTDRVHDHPTEDAALRFELLFDCYFVHSSVMMRKSALDAVGGYATDSTRHPPEDYELWSRLVRRYRVGNLPERLTIYREVPRSMSRERTNPFLDNVVMIAAENIAWSVGEAIPNRHHVDIAALTHRAFDKVSDEPGVESMCAIIREAGARIHADAPESDVPKRVTARIQNLRAAYHHYHHVILRRPGSFGPSLQRVPLLMRIKRKIATWMRP